MKNLLFPYNIDTKNFFSPAIKFGTRCRLNAESLTEFDFAPKNFTQGRSSLIQGLSHFAKTISADNSLKESTIDKFYVDALSTFDKSKVREFYSFSQQKEKIAFLSKCACEFKKAEPFTFALGYLPLYFCDNSVLLGELSVKNTTSETANRTSLSLNLIFVKGIKGECREFYRLNGDFKNVELITLLSNFSNLDIFIPLPYNNVEEQTDTLAYIYSFNENNKEIMLNENLLPALFDILKTNKPIELFIEKVIKS